MIITKRDVRYLREHMRLNISLEQEALILERFGSEPDEKHVWTGQDIYEQVRKLLRVRIGTSLGQVQSASMGNPIHGVLEPGRWQ